MLSDCVISSLLCLRKERIGGLFLVGVCVMGVNGDEKDFDLVILYIYSW